MNALQLTTALPPAPAATGKIYSALCKSQAAFTTIRKSGSMSYQAGKLFHYATLDDILAGVKPALNANGLFLFQDVRCIRTGAETSVGVKTIVVHESGERLESAELYMPVEQGRGNRAQAFGSARTYACRYSLASFLGISAEDDTDGNVPGMQPESPATRTPARRAVKPQNVEPEDIPY